MVKVIAEAGSCHMANIQYAKELINVAIDNHCWGIKFQLFRNLPPNIEFPREWWQEIREYTRRDIVLFASVFDQEAVDLLWKYRTPYIKKAYSMRHTHFKHDNSYEPQWIVSTSCIDVHKHSPKTIKLFCVPEYPVIYKIDFNPIFARYPFDGFSDHTLGYHQTLKAIEAGAKIIEKHITLEHSDIDIPDSRFALRPKELKEMMHEITRRFAE